MERYRRVEKAKADVPINENEIRITSLGLIRNYISYSSSLLQERQVREVVLKAMGQAINKTVTIAEIIKKRMPHLHQDTAISSVSITDVVEMTQHVSMISITLSSRELDKNSPGYQAPLHSDEARPQYHYQQQQQHPRQTHALYNPVDEDSYGRGRGRGRGGGRSGGGGGYGNYQWGNYRGGNYQGGYFHGGIYLGGGYHQGRGNYQGGLYNQDTGDYQVEGYNQGRSNYQGGYYQDNGGYSNYGCGGWTWQGLGLLRYVLVMKFILTSSDFV